MRVLVSKVEPPVVEKSVFSRVNTAIDNNPIDIIYLTSDEFDAFEEDLKEGTKKREQLPPHQFEGDEEVTDFNWIIYRGVFIREEP
jgi:uncharacterized protein (DUF1015 family)